MGCAAGDKQNSENGKPPSSKRPSHWCCNLWHSSGWWSLTGKSKAWGWISHGKMWILHGPVGMWRTCGTLKDSKSFRDSPPSLHLHNLTYNKRADRSWLDIHPFFGAMSPPEDTKPWFRRFQAWAAIPKCQLYSPIKPTRDISQNRMEKTSRSCAHRTRNLRDPLDVARTRRAVRSESYCPSWYSTWVKRENSA